MTPKYCTNVTITLHYSIFSHWMVAFTKHLFFIWHIRCFKICNDFYSNHSHPNAHKMHDEMDAFSVWPIRCEAKTPKLYVVGRVWGDSPYTGSAMWSFDVLVVVVPNMLNKQSNCLGSETQCHTCDTTVVISSTLDITRYDTRPFAETPQWTIPMSHNVPFCNRNMHISVTKWCIVRYLSKALRYLWDTDNDRGHKLP